MTSARPQMAGRYELLLDFETATATVRVIRLRSEALVVAGHVHQYTDQVYVATEGRTVVTCDGVETVLGPYEALPVPRGSLHSARAAGEESVVLNISVPPLRADDQAPLPARPPRNDLAMPTGDSDVED